MGKVFHHVVQIIVILIGLAMTAMGCVWILQGLGIAFLDSFMANQIQWTYYGVLLALAGLSQAIWAATRGSYFRDR